MPTPYEKIADSYIEADKTAKTLWLTPEDWQRETSPFMDYYKKRETGVSAKVTAPERPPPELSPLDTATIKREYLNRGIADIPLTPEELQAIAEQEYWGEQTMPPEFMRKQATAVSGTVTGAFAKPLFEVMGVPISAGDISGLVGLAMGAYQAGSPLLARMGNTLARRFQVPVRAELARGFKANNMQVSKATQNRILDQFNAEMKARISDILRTYQAKTKTTLPAKTAIKLVEEQAKKIDPKWAANQMVNSLRNAPITAESVKTTAQNTAREAWRVAFISRAPQSIAMQQGGKAFERPKMSIEEASKLVEKYKPMMGKAPITPQDNTQQIKAIQSQGKANLESISPEDAQLSHIELAAPDGPRLPPPPPPITEAREPDDVFREITELATINERPDQTLLRRHEAAIGTAQRRTNLSVRQGGQTLKSQGIGVWRRGHLVPRPEDISRLDALYVALHNPSKVASGEVKVPEGLEGAYRELRELTDWEEAARLDFDPEMATVEDYFYRGWKAPEGAFADVTQGRPLVKKPAFKKPRVDATYSEMREAGFEPLFWNPYDQWGLSRMQGTKYREQMQLVSHLKSMGEELIRPHDGGPIPSGWRVPEVGPAFEGKPFAIQDANGQPTTMFTRRWIAKDEIANTLENIYGKKPSLGQFVIAGKTIDPMAIIDFAAFVPKRAKLFVSFFQQVDFLTRAGAGSWTRFVDALMAGKPIEAIKSPIRYNATAWNIIKSNFSPAARQSLAKQLDSTESLVQGRPGIHFKGISEAGLSTRDVTIFPADMDKLVRQVATEAGLIGKLKRIPSYLVDLESAMRRGLFDGVYPAAIKTDIEKNIAPMVARQFESSNDAQINGMIARIANIKYSTIPASQSVFQNRIVRETLRRVFFSIGESEGLLRQATGAFKGPYANFWRKHWIGVYLFLIATANIIHFASTGEPLPKERYSPIAKDKWGPLPFGYNTEFASPTLPFKGRGGAELTLDLAGQMDTAFRVLDPVNFIASRESVPVRAVQNQISGTDFFGAPIDDVGPGGIVSRTSQLMHDLAAPIGAGGITEALVRQGIPGAEEVIPRGEERLGVGGLALQATGINIRAEDTKRLLDRWVRESGYKRADGTPVENWKDLEPHQRKELERNVQLQKEMETRSEVSVERGYPGAKGYKELDEIDSRYYQQEEALAEEFLQAKQHNFNVGISHEEFRDRYRAIQESKATDKAQAIKDFDLFPDEQKIPEESNERALFDYYDAYDKATLKSGRLDWDKLDRLMTSLEAKWNPEQLAYIERNTGLTEHPPLIMKYRQDVKKLKPYWEISEPRQSEKRESYRKSHPEIDRILVDWYGYKSVTGYSAYTPQVVPFTPWYIVQKDLNSTLLKALQRVWYNKGKLSNEEISKLEFIHRKYPLGFIDFNAWVKQGLRQLFENTR